MAAKDDGYDIANHAYYLDELRTEEGKEPIPGYASIALYAGSQTLRSFAIRVETGDIVDTQACAIYRYPDVLRFRSEIMKAFSTRSASLTQIASEVGCDKLVEKGSTAAAHK